MHLVTSFYLSTNWSPNVCVCVDACVCVWRRAASAERSVYSRGHSINCWILVESPPLLWTWQLSARNTERYSYSQLPARSCGRWREGLLLLACLHSCVTLSESVCMTAAVALERCSEQRRCCRTSLSWLNTHKHAASCSQYIEREENNEPEAEYRQKEGGETTGDIKHVDKMNE